MEHEDVPRPAWNKAKCVLLCISDVDCIGISFRLPTDQCLFINLDTINNKTIDGTLGTEREVVLRTFTCASLGNKLDTA